MITEATKANLRRKSAYVDHVQLLPDGSPLFSWVELSLTELCNRSKGHPRACPFCPRIDPKFYPNQNLIMSVKLAEKIANELKALDYQGVVVLCGYGEPLLNPGIADIVKLFDCRVEVVTNGDFLGPEMLNLLDRAGVDFFVVSLYDGPHQVSKMEQLFKEAGMDNSRYLLRDRWHSETDQFGLKLTNRAGVVSIGKQDGVDVAKPCHYLTYQVMIDWNGDVLLCPQDWHKKVKFGNLNIDSMLDIWLSKRMRARRLRLMKGRQGLEPCQECNTDGTLHGWLHAEAWNKK